MSECGKDQAEGAGVQKSLNRELEAIFDASSDGIWVCDNKGVILRLNKASARLNGIDPEAVIGRNINELVLERELDRSVTQKVIESGKQETVVQYVSRTRRQLLSTGTPSFDEKGNVDLIVVNERDLTELNSLRRELEENRKIKEKISEQFTDLSLLELDRSEVVAESAQMRRLLQMALKLSHLDTSTIMILGESGVGKGFLAKLIHKKSTRSKKPFVEINCAALPESLLEAELFGYEKGAFTDAAIQGKIGLLELAQGGTLFLDEIGDMPLPLQAKLLKYLDDGHIRRIGGTRSIRINCTTIAATNRELKKLVQEKLFREDLYFRLHSFVLKIPPLRGRTEDIDGLLRNYLQQFNDQYKMDKRIGSRGLRFLERYSFPGNIRELRNIIENGVVLSEQKCIDKFLFDALAADNGADDQEDKFDNATPAGLNLSARLAELEKELVQKARQTCSTTREMAKHLGISQPSVVRKMKKYGIG